MTAFRILKALSVAASAVAEAKSRLMAGIPIDECPGASEQEALQFLWDAWYQHTLERDIVGEVREHRPGRLDDEV
jgi:hypothetical protein